MLPTKGGHFIKEDPYAFDTSFFKLTAAEAAVLDPKQRILLEVTYEALENAGLPLPRVAGTRTACIIGTAWSDYRDALVRDFEQWPRLYLMGVSDEMISNRLSHYFDLRGPSLTVETACSSSLVAIHQACESLRSGQAEVCSFQLKSGDQKEEPAPPPSTFWDLDPNPVKRSSCSQYTFRDRWPWQAEST